MPCSLTPLTRKIVSGILVFRTWLRNVSCRFCARSAAIVLVPFLARSPTLRAFCQVALVPRFRDSDPRELRDLYYRAPGRAMQVVVRNNSTSPGTPDVPRRRRIKDLPPREKAPGSLWLCDRACPFRSILRICESRGATPLQEGLACHRQSHAHRCEPLALRSGSRL